MAHYQRIFEDEFKSKSVSNDISEAVIHELTHLWHYSLEGMKKLMSVDRNIRKAAKYGKLKSIDAYLKSLRLNFNSFFIGLVSEGIARYCEYASGGLIFFREDEFETNYRISAIISKQMLADIDAFLDKLILMKSELSKNNDKLIAEIENLAKKLHDEEYELGKIIVYSMIYIDKDLTLDDIGKMSHIKFIKTYESCMALKGLQPVISLNSGK